MRENSNRLSVNNEQDVASQIAAVHMQNISEQKQVEQNFAFTMPTEFVELPSKGMYYLPDHPLYNKASVELRYMTAKDEDILTNKSMIKQGIAIDRLLESLLIDKRIKAKDLLSGDKNAMLINARSSGYGSEYTTKITCPNCSNISEHTFDLLEVESKEEPNLDLLGVRKTEDSTFVVELPRSNMEVEFKFLTGKEEAEMLSTFEKREKKGMPQSSSTTYLSYIIVSINGISDRVQLNSLISSLPSYDAKYLREVYSKVVPNIDLRQNFNCPRCSFDQEVDIPITVDFFWSK